MGQHAEDEMMAEMLGYDNSSDYLIDLASDNLPEWADPDMFSEKVPHSNFSCQKCGKRVKTEHGLRNHMRDKHGLDCQPTGNQ